MNFTLSKDFKNLVYCNIIEMEYYFVDIRTDLETDLFRFINPFYLKIHFGSETLRLQ